jgi:RecA-family ATPase
LEGGDMADLGIHIEAVARKLLGAPNERRSTRTELRFDTGTYGMSVCIAGPKQGRWFDHDADEGGGVLDLLRVRGNLTNGAAQEWLRGIGIEVGARPEAKTPPRIVKTYDYTDAAGNLLFQVVRYEPKDFRQRRRDDKGEWVWSVKGTETVPYCLPDLIKAPLDETIYIVEGEKDVDTLRRLGLTATCNPGGKLKWPRHFDKYFIGRRVVAIPDNDADGGGLKHAQDVASKLKDAAASVRVTAFVEVGKDVSAWIEKGADRAAIERLAESVNTTETTAEPEAKVDILDLRPFLATDLDHIPPRPWLLGTTALRGAVTALSAPGGTSKSTLELERCIAIATGIPITGERVYERTRTWYLSAEDPREEVNRRIKAICLQFNIAPSLLEGWLFVHDLSDGPIKVAVRAETRIVHPDTAKLASTIEHYGIGYIAIDPLVSFHELNENDNVEMATVIRSISGVAQQTSCAFKVIAHARKGHLAGDADTMRGASAIRDGCRIVETLTTMTEEEAKKLNVEEIERRWLVRLDDAKANFAAPTEQVTWFRRESVDLDNGTATRPPDKVGVLRPFDMTGITQERQQQARAEQEKANDAVAEMIAGTITETEMTLKEAADSLAAALGRSTSLVREKIAAAIPIAPGGREIVVGGERIRLWIRRESTARTAPQTIVKQVIHD